LKSTLIASIYDKAIPKPKNSA